MNVNETAWGSAYTEFSGLNVRTGAEDLEDPDFEDYPPFVRNDFGTETEIQYIPKGDLYYPYLADNEIIGLNKPIERSIAYCACKNLDIPINKIWGYSCTPDSSSSQYPDLTDPSALLLQSDPSPVPIIFMDTAGIGQARNHGMPANQHYFRNPFYRSSQGVFYQQNLFTQYAQNEDLSGNEGTPYDNTGRSRSNKNLFAAYFRDFGVRSIFLTIYVTYYNSIGASTETPSGTNIRSLISYAAQTAEWKEAHPICCAFGYINRRSTTTGVYTNAGVNISADLTVNLRSNWNFGTVQIGDLIGQPIANVDTEYLQGILPIFGTFAPHHWITNATGSHASGGVSENVAVLIGGGENSPIVHRQGKSGTQYHGTVWCELEGSDENIELIRQWCAAYGLFFTDGASGDSGYADLYAAGNDSTRWTHEKMCLGVIDDEGLTDGTYTRGEGNTSANNFLWKTVSDSKYNPDKPPPSPDNQYSRQTIFNHIGDLASLTKRYVLSGSFVELLGEQLYNITYTLTDQDQDYTELENKIKSEFLVTNPIDCIIDLRRYPMQIPSEPDLVHLMLGRYDTGLNVYELARPCQTYLFELSSPIYPLFGDSFLDYSPWTSFELYVPFCGTVRLNPEDILGNQLAVQLVVDFTTGTCTGFIQSDDLVIETVTGTLGIDIPVSGIQSVTAASQLNNAILNRKEAQTSQVFQALNIVKGVSNPIGYMEGVIQKGTETQRADYNLQHTEAPVHVIGTSSPLTSWAIDLNCRLICYYPTSEEMFYIQNHVPRLSDAMLQRYGHIEGFATVEVNSIGSHSGLVIATDVNTQGISCSDEEREMIRSALSEGCYV